MKEKEDKDDWVDFPPELTRQLPASLARLSVQQALALLSFSLHINEIPSRSSQVTTATEIHQQFVVNQSALDKNESLSIFLISKTPIPERIVEFDSKSETIEAVNTPGIKSALTTQQIPECARMKTLSNKVDHTVKKSIDICKITEEICQEKMNELKWFLTTAHDTVTESVTEKIDKNMNESWITRNNSKSCDRAGKYHKEPAPKVPVAASSSVDSENLKTTSQQKAVKATTSVIKPGMIKKFQNFNEIKNIFVSHLPVTSIGKLRKGNTGIPKILETPKKNGI